MKGSHGPFGPRTRTHSLSHSPTHLRSPHDLISLSPSLTVSPALSLTGQMVQGGLHMANGRPTFGALSLSLPPSLTKAHPPVVFVTDPSGGVGPPGHFGISLLRSLFFVPNTVHSTPTQTYPHPLTPQLLGSGGLDPMAGYHGANALSLSLSFSVRLSLPPLFPFLYSSSRYPPPPPTLAVGANLGSMAPAGMNMMMF